MTDTQKLTRKQQLEEWRKQNRTPEKMAALADKTARDTLNSRLTFWGVIMSLAGASTLAIAIYAFKHQPVDTSGFFIVWGVLLLGLGIADLVSKKIVMLLPTGIATILHGILLLLGLNFIWGPVWIVAGIMMLRDAKKAFAREKAKAKETAQADGVA